MSDLSTPLAWSAPDREPLPETSRSGFGRKAEADTVEASFKRVWAAADIELTSSCLCLPGK